MYCTPFWRKAFLECTFQLASHVRELEPIFSAVVEAQRESSLLISANTLLMSLFAAGRRLTASITEVVYHDFFGLGERGGRQDAPPSQLSPSVLGCPEGLLPVCHPSRPRRRPGLVSYGSTPLHTDFQGLSSLCRGHEHLASTHEPQDPPNRASVLQEHLVGKCSAHKSPHTQPTLFSRVKIFHNRHNCVFSRSRP